jgi:hypothetical protein
MHKLKIFFYYDCSSCFDCRKVEPVSVEGRLCRFHQNAIIEDMHVSVHRYSTKFSMDRNY